MSLIGIYAGGLTLVAVVLALVAPFVPFLEMGASISLWGAATGSANSFIILAAATVGLVGGIVMMTSTMRPKSGTVGGILSMVAGVVTGGMAAYLLTNADHRALIAQGGTFGVAAWLLIAATGGLLIGGILGIVRGSATR